MELEWFCSEESSMQMFEFWLQHRRSFYQSLGLDMDWFYGDRAELRRWAGLPPEDEQPPQPVLTLEQRVEALEARVAALEK